MEKYYTVVFNNKHINKHKVSGTQNGDTTAFVQC